MLLRLEGETLPRESQGRVVPWGFGLLRDVPGIPIQVGYEAILADNCGVNETTSQPTLRISGPNLDRIRSLVPIPGVIAIDDEWLRYEAFLTDPSRLVISARGLGATVPAPHPKGSRVLFVEPRLIYAFLAAPPGHRYPPDAVRAVRINDADEVPHHTVRLRDTRLFGPAFPLLTVEFDLTRYFAEIPGAPGVPTVAFLAGASGVRDPIARAAARKRRRLQRHGALPVREAWRSLHGANGQPGFAVVPAYEPTQPPPPPTPRPVLGAVRITSRATPLPSRPTPVRTLRLPLGQVTADIAGLLDTPAGRLTGTPDAPLIHPAPITRLIAESAYGFDRLDLATWAATHARQVALGVTWRLRFDGPPWEQFRALAGYCGMADLYVSDAGRLTYRLRERQDAPVATLTDDDLLDELALEWTPRESVATRVAVTWGDDAVRGGTFTLRSPQESRYTAAHRPLTWTLDLPYLDTEAGARIVARYWLAQRDHQRQVAQLRVGPPHLALTRTDRVRLDTPLANTWGPARVFEIRGTTDRGGERVLRAVEADPPAVVIALTCRLRMRLTPDAGVMGLTGWPPSVASGQTTIRPDGGILTLLGLSPLISPRLTPSSGPIAITGLVPTLGMARTSTPATGTLALTGWPPAVTSGPAIRPEGGTLTLLGLGPRLALGLIPSPGVVAITGLVPSLALGRTTPGAGTLGLAGVAPAVVTGGDAGDAPYVLLEGGAG
jgi:hypothetical protein